MTGTILRLKSDDEVLRNFKNIESFGTLVLAGQKTLLQKIDRHNIKTSELPVSKS